MPETDSHRTHSHTTTQVTQKIKYLRFVDGTRIAMRDIPARQFILEPIVLRFYIICIAIWAVLDVRPGLPMGPWTHMTFTVCIGVLFYAALLALAPFLDFLFSSGRVKTLFTPFFAVPLLLGSEALVFAAFRALEIQADILPPEYALVLLQSIVSLFLFEVIFAHYVIRQHPAYLPMMEDVSTAPSSGGRETEPGSSEPEPEPAKKPVTEFSFSNITVPYEDLCVIQAEDHYVRVVTAQETKVVRGRFSDALIGVPERLGIQLNRSAWVARSHIKHAERSADYTLRVIMNDGTAMPVARARKAGVTQKIKDWDISLRRIK